MSWDEKKIEILKNEWGKGKTASQIAEMIGGVSRNAVIGKAHRLNLSIKIKSRNISRNYSSKDQNNEKKINLTNKRLKFRSLVLDKNFETAKNISLEELTENTCKYMEGHPNESDSSFCGRKTVDKFSYCPLHLMIVYQPKGKKEDVALKDEDVPTFLEKKVKSA
tara:strand:- start:12992 stop:13486 length:495 start_codon:yes stop_codon:yes gene_type:complete